MKTFMTHSHFQQLQKIPSPVEWVKPLFFLVSGYSTGECIFLSIDSAMRTVREDRLKLLSNILTPDGNE